VRRAIRRFNDRVAADPRTRQVIVPIGDGLTLIRRA
jgi:predicted O-methyltransferase YrrM